MNKKIPTWLGIVIIIIAASIAGICIQRAIRANISKSALPVEKNSNQKQGEAISCQSKKGTKMDLEEAKGIAAKSECGDKLAGKNVCNDVTGTWWLDLNLKKEGCSPACVINVETKEAVINWRCTGLILKK